MRAACAQPWVSCHPGVSKKFRTLVSVGGFEGLGFTGKYGIGCRLGGHPGVSPRGPGETMSSACGGDRLGTGRLMAQEHRGKQLSGQEGVTVLPRSNLDPVASSCPPTGPWPEARAAASSDQGADGQSKLCEALKQKVNPTNVPIEAKESVRWLENLRQSSARLADPARCVHIGDRESDIYSCFARPWTLGRISCCERAWIDSLATAVTRSQPRCPGRAAKDCTGSRCPVETANGHPPSSSFGIEASRCCRRSASKAVTRA